MKDSTRELIRLFKHELISYVVVWQSQARYPPVAEVPNDVMKELRDHFADILRKRRAEYLAAHPKPFTRKPHMQGWRVQVPLMLLYPC